jgi:hypothetical protein
MDIDVKDPKFLRWVGAILVVLVVVPTLVLPDGFLPLHPRGPQADPSTELEQPITRS